MNYLVGGLLVSVLAVSSLKGDDIKLPSNDANDFLGKLQLSKRSLYEECYVEGCDFEEVKEVKGGGYYGEKYYATYKCKKFKINCPEPDCGSGREPEGAYSQRCRSSCRPGEHHQYKDDKKCKGGRKCCMCHSRNGRCTVDL